jgi:hypothetical protein
VADLDDLSGPEQGGGVSRRSGAMIRSRTSRSRASAKADGFFQARLSAPGGGLRVPVGVDDDGALDRRRVINEFA